MNSALVTIWDSLNALPRPITYDDALTTAKQVCIQEGKDPNKFEAWFSTESQVVLERLNV